MLPSIVEKPFIHSVGVSQNSLPMEFIVTIKSALILKVTCWSFPNELSFGPCSVSVQSFIAIVISNFNAVAMEFIILEASSVLQLVRLIVALSAFLGLGDILIEASVIKRAISGNECSFAVPYALIEISYIDAPIFLIHSSKPMRNASCLPNSRVTSSSYPM